MQTVKFLTAISASRSLGAHYAVLVRFLEAVKKCGSLSLPLAKPTRVVWHYCSSSSHNLSAADFRSFYDSDPRGVSSGTLRSVSGLAPSLWLPWQWPCRMPRWLLSFRRSLAWEYLRASHGCREASSSPKATAAMLCLRVERWTAVCWTVKQSLNNQNAELDLDLDQILLEAVILPLCNHRAHNESRFLHLGWV